MIEVMTQISKGIENEVVTLDRVHVLVQTVVFDTIDKGNDPKVAEARFQVILDSKEVLAKSGSGCLFHCHLKTYCGSSSETVQSPE